MEDSKSAISILGQLVQKHDEGKIGSARICQKAVWFLDYSFLKLDWCCKFAGINNTVSNERNIPS